MNTTSTSYTAADTINLTSYLHTIITDIVSRFPSFSHIACEKILVCIAANRAGSRGATFGKLVPMKFKGGEDVLLHRGKYYAMPKIEMNSVKILYLVYFYIPRFTDLDPVEKLRVIFHELYHIHPDCNGDIRRFGKSGSAHGNSKKRFDTRFEREVIEYANAIRETKFWEFLSLNTKGIFATYRTVLSCRMKMPRPIPIDQMAIRQNT
jgi:hypothetical protein